jgi:arylsulfatase A-like enzyme
MYEGGHRVPGMFRWPGRIAAGGVSDLPVIGSDLFPTLLAAAGLVPPADRTLDGANLLPAFAGGQVNRTKPLYWRFGGRVAYREGDWKVVSPETLERPELYNLALDRGERHDLAMQEPERLAGMMSRLRAYTAEIESEGPDWWRRPAGKGAGRNPGSRQPGKPKPVTP